MKAPAITLRLRPAGRGNWSTLVVTFDGRRAQELASQLVGADLLGLRPRARVVVGGAPWRVVEVVENRAA